MPYQDVVDIEVSIQAKDAMNIGVFGSHGRLGEHGAEDVVRMIVDVLNM